MEYLGLALKMVQQIRARRVRDEAVLAAMIAVPRHLFVPEVTVEAAYSDQALSIGQGQTISQPFVVARMTELLHVRSGNAILEIGTGSGYQAALLGHMGARVVSVERRSALAEAARERLDWIVPGADIQVVVGDGSLGHAPEAPYDGIVVTAAAPALPEAFQEQLAGEGRIVIPIGDRDMQKLTVFERHGARWDSFFDFDCRFVPLVGKDAWGSGD